MITPKKLSRLNGSRNWVAFFTVGLTLLVSSASARDIVYYAEPRSNGVWFGESAKATLSGHERSVGDLSAVIAAVRTARKPLGPDAHATIFLHGGIYELAAPLVLTPEDSGLTISAYGDETPMISGGQRLTGWKNVPGKPGWWETVIPSVKDGKWNFHSLFVNGQPAQRARTPNVGSFFVMQGDRFADKPIEFHFKAGDIKPEWASDPDIELVGFETWISYRMHICAVNTKDHTVKLSGNENKWTRETGGGRYFIENTADALDVPGEWYLDRKTGVLTYIARPGEDMNRAELIAPRLTELMSFEGGFLFRRPVEHVALRGLTFSYTDWNMPAKGWTVAQSAAIIRGDIRAVAMTDCQIKNCIFTHLGNFAVELGGGCQRDMVAGCQMVDLGGGGIHIGEPVTRSKPFQQNNSHVITDNHIWDIGTVHTPASGILIMRSGTNFVAHNEIDHLFYSAIAVGWTWGYEKTPCCENIIEFNHLHDIGQGVLSDMGAVYTVGPQTGTVVRNNLIHDVKSFSYGGWGLYADEGSSAILFENNIIYNTKTGGLHQHYGSGNVVSNNIFADGRQWQLQFTRPEDHRSFTFVNNIVYWTQGGLLDGVFNKGQTLMESNLYWNACSNAINFAPTSLQGGENNDQIMAARAKAPVVSLEQWQAQGHDQGSIIADPRFVAPEKFDFTLEPGSPALKLGFKPINMMEVGVRREKTQP